MARVSVPRDALNPPVKLTEYADLHGCSCKLGQSDLQGLLAEVGLDTERDELLFGVGEDAGARKLTEDLATVSTIDYFTPIIDDPHEFGRVAVTNAASDAYAKGATDALSFLVVLGLPKELTEYASAVLSGIADGVEEMDGVIVGGHTIISPWPIAGAAVNAVAPPDSLVTTRNAAPEDVLYLTKPLGTQPAMGALRVKDGEFGDQVRAATDRDVETIGREALEWMSTPNREAALAFESGPVTAATDITGFGLRGQSEQVATRSGVGFEITHVPVIAGTAPLSELFGYGLLDGDSAETSGGLLVSVAPEGTDVFEESLDERDVFYREVGRVTDGSGVTLADPTVEAV
ncbi:MAG: selenide, water dikinase SelD [Halodesulfurarchaeum sp.]